jgi:perosamine synthetase
VKDLGISDQDEVITTAFSFIASANCVLFERGRPVFVDIEASGYNIDPQRIEDAITPRTKAILPVHVFGRPCNMNAILEVAKRHDLAVLEDACEAVGARYQHKPVGGLGDAGTFAFYPNKQITTGEGGVIVTNHESIARTCRSMRNQGRSESNIWLEHTCLGYNYRLSELNCALGVPQLRRIEQIVRVRAKVAATYEQALADIPAIVTPALHEPQCEISWFVYVIRLHDEFTVEHRDQILAELQKDGVECRNYFPPLHLQRLYRDRFGHSRGMLPITEHVADRTISLPFFNQLSDLQIEYVCSALRRAISTIVFRERVFATSGASRRWDGNHVPAF